MPARIALLRGVNVGGRAIISMVALKGAFEAAGFENVRTYIQSGNVLFTARKTDLPGLDRKVRARLGKILKRDPVIIYRSREDLRACVDRAPAGEFARNPRIKLYVTFLAEAPHAKTVFPLVSDKEGLEVRKLRPRDLFVVSRMVATGRYGFPNNFIERELGVAATSRNLTTVRKLLDLSS